MATTPKRAMRKMRDMAIPRRRTECGFCDDGVAVIAGKPQPCPYCEADR